VRRERVGMTHDRFLGCLVVATAVSVLVVLVDAAGVSVAPLRIVCGLFLACFAPGAALLAAVAPPFLAGVARAVLAIPVSFGILAVAGVVVDRTPAGVTPASMVAFTAVVTALLLAVAAARSLRRRAGSSALPVPRKPVRTRSGIDPDATGRGVVAAPRASENVARARALVAAGMSHVRDPLFLNAYSLGMSGAVTSALGVVYWAVAARVYPADVVGVNAAVLSLVTLLTNVAQLNLRSGFGRFLPIAGNRTTALVLGGYAVTTLLATILAFAVVALLALAPGVLPDVALTPLLAVLFVLTVVLWTAFTVQDHVLVGLRRTPIVPIENGVFALAKVVLLIALGGVLARYGIIVSWLLPTAVGVVVVTGWILFRVLPRRRREDHGSGERIAANDIVGYVGADYVGALFAIGSTAILPVMVLGALGAASSAHYYVVSLIVMGTQLVPLMLSTSLLVEVSASSASFEADGRRVLRQVLLLLGPLVAVIVLFAGPILSIFGADYASEGVAALRLMALAALPYALIKLAFIRLRIDRRVRVVVAAQAVLALLLVVGVSLILPVAGITGLGVVFLAAHGIVAVALSIAELRPLLAGFSRDVLRALDRARGARVTAPAGPAARERPPRMP